MKEVPRSGEHKFQSPEGNIGVPRNPLGYIRLAHRILGTPPDVWFTERYSDVPQEVREFYWDQPGDTRAMREPLGTVSQAPDRVARLMDAVDASLLTLTSREAEALRLRFSLNDPSANDRLMTHKKVGERIPNPVGRARTGQIELKALRKLRHPVRRQERDAIFQALSEDVT